MHYLHAFTVQDTSRKFHQHNTDNPVFIQRSSAASFFNKTHKLLERRKNGPRAHTEQHPLVSVSSNINTALVPTVNCLQMLEPAMLTCFFLLSNDATLSIFLTCAEKIVFYGAKRDFSRRLTDPTEKIGHGSNPKRTQGW